MEVTYLHNLNKNGIITKKGIITVEDVISSTGRDICIFLESLRYKKTFAKHYRFSNFKNKNAVIEAAVEEFCRTL
jgi:hypothetical protein